MIRTIYDPEKGSAKEPHEDGGQSGSKHLRASAGGWGQASYLLLPLRLGRAVAHWSQEEEARRNQETLIPRIRMVYTLDSNCPLCSGLDTAWGAVTDEEDLVVTLSLRPF